MNQFKKSKLHLALWSAMSISTVWASTGDLEVSVDIKSQAMSTSLIELAKKANVQIVLDKRLDAGTVVSAISGSYTLNSALEMLLNGTGLTFEYTSDDLVMIREKEESKSGSKSDESVEEVVVTGSALLKDPGQVTKNVTIYDRKTIEASGATTLDEFMRTIPQNINAATEVASGFAGDFGGAANVFGASGINLRGLGEQATLVLIDGRRTANGGALGNAVDITTIPLSQVERIDVLLDGASSIYGSDAVGGVVNIITRKDYEGGTITAEYKTALDGGTEQFQLTVAKTFSWGSGNLSVNYSHLHRTPLNGEERPELQFSSRGPLSDALASMPIANPSNFTATGRTYDPATFEIRLSPLYYVDADGVRHPSKVWDDNAWGPNYGGFLDAPIQPGWREVYNGQLPASGALTLNSAKEGFQDGPAPTYARSLIPERNDHNIRVNIKQELTDDINFDAAFTYGISDSNSSISQQEIALTSDATIVVDPSISPWAAGNAAPNPNNPFGTEISFSTILHDVPNHARESERETISASIGFDGSFNDNWRWDIGLSYSEADNNAVSYNQFDNNALWFLLGGYDYYNARDPETGELVQTNFAANYDIFSSSPYFGAGRDAFMADFVYDPQPIRGRNIQEAVEATLQGELFSLPSGGVNTLIRFGRRETEQLTQELSYANGGRLISSSLFGGGVGQKLHSQGVQTTDYVAAEAFVPLVGSDNGLPLVESLALSLSGRLDKLNYFDDKQRSLGLGVVWDLNETFRVRYNHSDAFSAPAFAAYTQPITVVPNNNAQRFFEDDGVTLVPFTGGERYVAAYRYGGNPNLEAAESTSKTLSLDITPTSLEGFKATISYHKEERIKELGNFPAPAIKASDIVLGQTDPAAFMAKYPGVSVLDENPSSLVSGASAFYLFDRRVQNTGDTKSDGVDLRMSYFFDTNIGEFDFILDYGRTLSYERRSFNGCDGVDCSLSTGNETAYRNDLTSINAEATKFWDLVEVSPEGSPYGAIPKHRATLRTSWAYNGFEVSLNASYQSNVSKVTKSRIAPLSADNVDTVGQIRTYKTEPRFDLVAWYDFNALQSVPGWLQDARIKLSLPDLTESKTTLEVSPVLPLDQFAPLVPQFVSPYGRTATLSFEKSF